MGSNPIATARAATTIATPSEGDSGRRSASIQCPRCSLACAIQRSTTWRSANRMTTSTMKMIGPGSHFRLADRNASRCDQETILGPERAGASRKSFDELSIAGGSNPLICDDSCPRRSLDFRFAFRPQPVLALVLSMPRSLIYKFECSGRLRRGPIRSVGRITSLT